ncbi:MAG: hypothetical protein ACI35S_02300 [Anaeroplasma sp.]
MIDLEKKIINELDDLVPVMSDKLINHPIKKREKLFYKKKLLFPLGGLALIMSSCIFFVSIFLGAKNIKKLDYYVVEINPQVMLSTDLNGNICEVKSGNYDADELLLLIGDNLVGMDINDGISYISSTALEIGYFDANDENAMKISSTNEDSLAIIKANLTHMFCNQGYYVAIITSKFDENENKFDNLNSFSYLNEVNEDDFINAYMNNYYKDYLKQQIIAIYQMDEYINKLYDIYNYLINDDKIPSLIKDYWYLMENKDSIKFDIDISNKLLEFEEYIMKYYELSGIMINDYIDLKFYKNKLSIIKNTTNSLIDVLDVIDAESLFETINNLIVLFDKVAPSISNGLRKYNIIPQNIDEYYETVISISIEKINKKIANYKDEYVSEKTQITNDDYFKFENKIINDYGSLENFYKDKEKNKK